MLEINKTVWIALAHGVESVADAGAGVWREPAAVRKALGELLGVLALTHGQLDLEVMLGAEQAGDAWRSVIEGGADTSLRELTLAINDAFRPPKVWGVGLPAPGHVARMLGDESERATLKVGLQMASRLKMFRDAGAAFVTIDLSGVQFAEQERALAPILRNAGMYGWQRALCVPEAAAAVGLEDKADAILALDSEESGLRDGWQQGSAIGGGLTERFWKEGSLTGPPAPRFLLFGRIPGGTSPGAIVAAGRTISSWL